MVAMVTTIVTRKVDITYLISEISSTYSTRIPDLVPVGRFLGKFFIALEAIVLK